MVIERFKDGDAKAVYQRFRERGRMAPEGLRYLDSWVEETRGRCFQLMACEDPEDSGRPISHWTGREIADEIKKRGIVDHISPRHAARLLKRS